MSGELEKASVRLTVQTHDRTRIADVQLPRSLRVSDLVDASQQNWALSRDDDYNVVNLTRGSKALLSGAQLTADLVQDGDVLEIQPLLRQGRRAHAR